MLQIHTISFKGRSGRNHGGSFNRRCSSASHFFTLPELIVAESWEHYQNANHILWSMHQRTPSMISEMSMFECVTNNTLKFH